MAELEARFESDPNQGWRKPLPPGEAFLLGRHPGDGGWQTEWDNFISRQHATVTWDGTRLSVARKPTAGNPIFYKGAPADEFSVQPGEAFRIGNTVFTVIEEEPAEGPIEVAASAKELSKVRFENSDQRIERTLRGSLRQIAAEFSKQRSFFRTSRRSLFSRRARKFFTQS